MYIMERKSGGSSTQKILQELKCKKKKILIMDSSLLAKRVGS